MIVCLFVRVAIEDDSGEEKNNERREAKCKMRNRYAQALSTTRASASLPHFLRVF